MTTEHRNENQSRNEETPRLKPDSPLPAGQVTIMGTLAPAMPWVLFLRAGVLVIQALLDRTTLRMDNVEFAVKGREMDHDH